MQTDVLKKNHLLTPVLTKCSECDVEKSSGSTNIKKMAKNLPLVHFFCSSAEPTETNVWVQFWFIPYFKLSFRKDFIVHIFQTLQKKTCPLFIFQLVKLLHVKMANWWILLTSDVSTGSVSYNGSNLSSLLQSCVWQTLLYKAHLTLQCTSKYTLHTQNWTLNKAHCTLHITHIKLNTEHWKTNSAYHITSLASWLVPNTGNSCIIYKLHCSEVHWTVPHCTDLLWTALL